MNTKQALTRSLATTQNVREKTIDTLRAQLKDQLRIAGRSLDNDDFNIAAEQFANAAATSQALHENLELDAMSRCTVAEASDETLLAELVKRAESKEPGATETRKAIAATQKRLTQPKRGAP